MPPKFETEAQHSFLLTMPELITTENIFERFKPPYSSESALDLLEYHLDVAALNQSCSSYYFNFCGPSDAEVTSPLVSVPYHQLRFKGGQLKSFSPKEIAVMIHEQMRAYIDQATFHAFPVGDPRQVQELVSLMISGFDAKTLCVVAQYKDLSPVGMVRANLGSGSKPIADAIGDEQSNLDTFSSLTIPVGTFKAEFPDLAATPSEQVVCIGRFAIGQDALKNLQLDPNEYPRLSLKILGYLGLTIEQVNATLPHPVTQIIFDTHEGSGVKHLSEKYLGGFVVAEGQAVVPTTLTAQSVLRHHYGLEGHQGQIYAMATSVINFTEGGKQFRLSQPQLELETALQSVPEKKILICNNSNQFSLILPNQSIWN